MTENNPRNGGVLVKADQGNTLEKPSLHKPGPVTLVVSIKKPHLKLLVLRFVRGMSVSYLKYEDQRTRERNKQAKPNTTKHKVK